jgi:hypothetical protein
VIIGCKGALRRDQNGFTVIFDGFWVSHLRSFPPSCGGTLNIWEIDIQSSKSFTIGFVQDCIHLWL